MGDARSWPEEERRERGTGDKVFVLFFENSDRLGFLLDLAAIKIEKANAIAGFGECAEISHDILS
jgi:hypothetical protein